MAQDTNLVVNQVDILPSRQMEANAYYVGNESLAMMAKPLSELLFYFPKCDSNNSATVCNPKDKLEVKKQLDWYLKIKAVARQYIVSQPEPAMELELAIIYPADFEMQKFKNKCIEQVAKQVFRHLQVLMGLEEKGMKLFISEPSFKILDDSEARLVAVMAEYFDNPAGAPPALAALGRLLPDPDFDYVRLREPSPDSPREGHPDAADVALKQI